ncbi:MAG: hypothetical protein H0Z29_09410 [Candidatus Marinimicrobia bacterium]|nr:hypothetical protein [Candidatus Neomarinimicrobiota bacterium]
MKRKICIFVLSILLLLFKRCITNYFELGRTLDRGELAITGGVENITADTFDRKNPPSFRVSLKLTCGMRYNFEGFIKASLFPYLYEFGLRYQVTPRKFTLFDMAIGAGQNIFINIFSQEIKLFNKRFGGSISKEVYRFVPYFSIYYNSFDINEVLNFKIYDYINTQYFRTIEFGIAFKLRNASYIIPAISTIYLNNKPVYRFYGISIYSIFRHRFKK